MFLWNTEQWEKEQSLTFFSPNVGTLSSTATKSYCDLMCHVWLIPMEDLPSSEENGEVNGGTEVEGSGRGEGRGNCVPNVIYERKQLW